MGLDVPLKVSSTEYYYLPWKQTTVLTCMIKVVLWATSKLSKFFFWKIMYALYRNLSKELKIGIAILVGQAVVKVKKQ